MKLKFEDKTKQLVEVGQVYKINHQYRLIIFDPNISKYREVDLVSFHTSDTQQYAKDLYSVIRGVLIDKLEVE